MGLDILAAYDGSAHGDRALEYACQLGSWNEGSVTAVYAVQPDIYDAAKSDGLSNLSEEYRRQVLETIDEAERRMSGQQVSGNGDQQFDRMRRDYSIVRAMASAWPRSSAPMPGYAPGVSTSVKTGRSKRSAMRMRRCALR